MMLPSSTPAKTFTGAELVLLLGVACRFLVAHGRQHWRSTQMWITGSIKNSSPPFEDVIHLPQTGGISSPWLHHREKVTTN